MSVSAYSHPKYRTGYAICVAVGRSDNIWTFQTYMGNSMKLRHVSENLKINIKTFFVLCDRQDVELK